MMSLWDALRMNMMISYQELVRTFPKISPQTVFVQHSKYPTKPMEFAVFTASIQCT
ncbi:hypothetical protein BvCms16BK_00406 [Escherichia coli]|nr:hypothetical protein BvCms14BK_00484 [Escherichia coli]GCG41472.1 hypothetical protein BvCms16BK_00406 [Escherichia coli]GCN37465.1 hypothetical protein BvCms1806_00735 [Escherichia coli]